MQNEKELAYYCFQCHERRLKVWILTTKTFKISLVTVVNKVQNVMDSKDNENQINGREGWWDLWSGSFLNSFCICNSDAVDKNIWRVRRRVLCNRNKLKTCLIVSNVVKYTTKFPLSGCCKAHKKTFDFKFLLNKIVYKISGKWWYQRTQHHFLNGHRGGKFGKYHLSMTPPPPFITHTTNAWGGWHSFSFRRRFQWALSSTGAQQPWVNFTNTFVRKVRPCVP